MWGRDLNAEIGWEKLKQGEIVRKRERERKRERKRERERESENKQGSLT